eukprot:CAMPEP_0181216006 /NCGR_PEP_ID=MMETSP1096-20121128/26338_1 /TAXON_ID=156174 ORGANISM="Chrysochromulina ericina, Strain CCMP281" /NCGR_SAMPLE_ID=MMETSP1096 /ASSEMBLY_ACC=CAM_ASM_000453 /LENGTH=117 /DNA_ID=CAMNT_0023307943 /DNA_START=321 /DNA_END=675 /DNA_ORIENTATION=+
MASAPPQADTGLEVGTPDASAAKGPHPACMSDGRMHSGYIPGTCVPPTAPSAVSGAHSVDAHEDVEPVSDELKRPAGGPARLSKQLERASACLPDGHVANVQQTIRREREHQVGAFV